MKSIVLFGDSLLSLFSRNLIFLLEEKIDDVTIYNCATGGFNTRDALKRANFFAQLKADYVCISLGVNDCNPFKGQPVPLEEFAENLTAIIQSFAGSKVILFPCPPVHDPIDPLDAKNFNNLLSQYNEAINKIAAKTNADVLDSTSVYVELTEKGEGYHLDDGIHLNTKGYHVFIEELSKLIG